MDVEDYQFFAEFLQEVEKSRQFLRKNTLDDLREWAQKRDQKGTTYYELEWFTDLLDAYEKDRNGH